MSKNWYILHTFTGYENKIEKTIRSYLDSNELDSSIVIDVKVPTEEVQEKKNDKTKIKKVKILPGYVMLEMDMPELGWKDTCNKLRRIQGVTGFVGTSPSERPRPISPDEAKRMLARSGDIKGEKAVLIKQTFEVGDQVKIIEGPFATFSGAVEEVNIEKEKLRVMVNIFARVTPFGVDFSQVEKI